jgi:hypothetical protein
MGSRALTHEEALQGQSSPLVTDGRFVCLIAALLIYAVRGTPTPDHMGYSEIFVAFLLLAATGPAGILYALTGRDHRGFSSWGLHTANYDDAKAKGFWAWTASGRFLFLYGMTFPVIIGILRGHDPLIMMRDILPFIFMMMPLFLTELVQQSRARVVIFTMTVVTIGLIFSWRVLWPVFLELQQWEGLLKKLHPSDPAYLANAPTVLFAALLLLGLAGLQFYRSWKLSHWGTGILLAALAAIPFVTMGLILQRASAGVTALVIGIWLVLAFIKYPYRALPLWAFMGAALAVAWPWVSMILGHLIAKSDAVGLNSRAQESLAILELVSENFFVSLFGYGWGASFASPAVGDLDVHFTHNMATTFWFKTGLLGCCALILYLFTFVKILWRISHIWPILGLALAAPFLIDITLYASFKSLDFGLLLLLIGIWDRRRSRLVTV